MLRRSYLTVSRLPIKTSRPLVCPYRSLNKQSNRVIDSALMQITSKKHIPSAPMINPTHRHIPPALMINPTNNRIQSALMVINHPKKRIPSALMINPTNDRIQSALMQINDPKKNNLSNLTIIANGKTYNKFDPDELEFRMLITGYVINYLQIAFCFYFVITMIRVYQGGSNEPDYGHPHDEGFEAFYWSLCWPLTISVILYFSYYDIKKSITL